MINPDSMRDAAISEYMDSMSENSAHQCAGLIRLCNTMENIGRIRELSESNRRRGYSAPTLREVTNGA